MTIKVFIVDDHQLFIDGLKAILRNKTDIEVVGQALSGKICIELLRNTEIDVLITDVNMPQMKGDELIRHLKSIYPNIKILTLSMHNDYTNISNMLDAGALGYVLKNTGAKELTEAIKIVNTGENYYSPAVQETIVKGYSKEKTTFSKDSESKTKHQIFLTPREKEILKLIISGMNSNDIGDSLSLSYHTVTSHRKNISAKLGVKSINELSTIAEEKGLI